VHLQVIDGEWKKAAKGATNATAVREAVLGECYALRWLARAWMRVSLYAKNGDATTAVKNSSQQE